MKINADELRSSPRKAERGSVVRLPAHFSLVAMLRDLIIEGELTEDNQLLERCLCDRLSTSRGPLREALKAIAAEGLIELVPNCGAKLVRYSRKDILDILDLLRIMETAAGQIACTSASEAQFAAIGETYYRMARMHALKDWHGFMAANNEHHRQIVDAAGNRALSENYRLNEAKLRSYRYQFYFKGMSEADRDQLLGQALRDHRGMFEAIAARDPGAVADATAQHYRMTPRYHQELARIYGDNDEIESGSAITESNF